MVVVSRPEGPGCAGFGSRMRNPRMTIASALAELAELAGAGSGWLTIGGGIVSEIGNS